MPDDLDDAAPPLVDQLARANVKARLGIAPAEATRVGRFAILGPIGAGGMGVVYSAYDDELARKVAIKLVRPGRNDPDIQARSRREAQALARLSHPNVVQVYEVGEYMGQVYVAMEYIQGKTLRAWQSSMPRSWREVVAMYRQVGLGLAAAHARGLVHRDFKPDNVLVGDDDQRPRVLDFGLARVRTRDSTPDLAPPPFTPLETDPPRDLSARPSSHDLSKRPPEDPPLRDLSNRPSRDPRSPHPDLPERTPEAHRASRHDLPERTPTPLSPAIDSTILAAPSSPAIDSTILATPSSPSLDSTALATPHRSPTADNLSERPAALDRTQFASPIPAAPADARLTVPGAVLGTPAYMAPEQLAGGEADARSDVFSFCVALYEALLRIRPFPGDRSDTLLAAVQRGELARPERPPDIPAWLLRVVERGLTADPAARWPAMDPLLAALARDPTRTRRRLALALLALALSALAVYALLDWQDRRQSEARARERAAEQARTADAEAETVLARAAADSERQRNEAHRLAQSAAQVAGTDPTLGLLLAVEAVRVHHDVGLPPTLEAAQALRDALGNVTSVPFIPPGAPAIVDAVAESPDGLWLATGQRSGAVTLWSTADPRHPHVLLPANDRAVRALEFSRARLAALRDEPGGPHVWTLPPAPVPSDIQPPVRWDSPEPDLHDLAWSPDGAALLTRAGNVALVLHETTPARILRSYTTPVRRALWAAEGRILTISDDTALTWPATTRGPMAIHAQKLDGPPTAAAVAPDGRTHVIPVDRGEPVQTIGIGFTSDHEAVRARSDGTIHTLDGEDQTAFTHMREVLGGVRFAPGADLFLGTPDGGAVYLWQRARPGDPLVLHGHRASVVTARFSADGQRILTGSADGSARRWHILDDPAVLRGHDAGIEHASFASDARRIVTAAMDGTVRVWPRDRRPAKILTGHREGSSVRAMFSPDGARLATAGSDGLARLWSLTDPVPTLIATLPAERERGPSIVALAWHPRGDLLAFAGDDGRVHLVHAAPGPPVRTVILTGPVGPTSALAFAEDRLAAAGDDATVRVWTLADPPVLADSFTGHTAPIRDLGFAGPRLASASDDATVRVWTHAAAPTLLTGHRGAVAQVRVHPDGTTLLTASADGTSRIWPQDADSIVLTGHADALWLAAWSPDGAQILTASADGSARLWSRQHDTWHGVLLPQLGAPGTSDPALWTGGFSPDGRLVLVAGADALARVFLVALADQLAAACARAGRDLDPAAWARTMGDRPHRPTCP